MLDDEDKILGFIFLLYSLSLKRQTKLIRGPYNSKRSEDILKTILYEESEKGFKSHIR